VALGLTAEASERLEASVVIYCRIST
jgi:hypothetical protein